MVAFTVLAILTIAAILVSRSVRRAREHEAAQEQMLVQNGFKTCADDKALLDGMVRALRNSPVLGVRTAWKRGTGDAAIYWYEVSSPSGESPGRLVADEFLCTLGRRSQQPLLLYLQPVKLGKGAGARLIENLIIVTAPEGLSKLDISGSKHSEGILAAFGPEGASIDDLLDAEQLAVLARGARYGVSAVRAVGNHCTLELFSAYARKGMPPVSWLETWSFVRQVEGCSTSMVAAP